MEDIQQLIGQEVELTYLGINYKGKLIGAGASEVYLQTLTNQVELPLSGVTKIQALPERKT